jgi:hypothetical protein
VSGVAPVPAGGVVPEAGFTAGLPAEEDASVAGWLEAGAGEELAVVSDDVPDVGAPDDGAGALASPASEFCVAAVGLPVPERNHPKF